MQRLNWLLYHAPHVAKLVGPIYATALSAFFLYSGVLFPKSIPPAFSSSNELLGQSLLLILTPALLLTYLVVAQRRSLRVAGRLLADRIVEERPTDWLQPPSARFICVGVVAGLCFGFFFNLLPEWRTEFGSIGIQSQSIAVAQLLLWTIAGFVLAVRLDTACRLYAKGRDVPLDLYDTSNLEPFARNGLDDVLAITMLLGISTIQSLDAQFRLGNYANAWMIAVPAAGALLCVPMWSVHRRLQATKRARLDQMQAEIAAAPRGPETRALAQFELLMQHRDRIRHVPTWPIDFSIASRLVFYVFIPPLAWVGAALVEFALGRVLSGQ